MLRSRWLLALPVCFVMTACAPPVSIGTPCVRNSECIEPLACVDGRCGSECTLHRDCIGGARCVVVEEGVGRCFVDAAPQCDEDVPCGFPGLTCLDRRCYAGCENCPSDGVCVEGFCYRQASDAGASGLDAGTSGLDAGVEPGTPNREACVPLDVEPCASGGHCESAYFAAAVCRAPCAAHSECAPGLCVRAEGSTGQCTIPCDPLTSGGCLGTDSCDHLYFQVEEMYLEVWECRRTGPGTSGEPCTADQPMGCGRGLTCTSDSVGEFCRPLCDTDDDDCGAGFRCRALSDGLRIGDRIYGACTPAAP